MNARLATVLSVGLLAAACQSPQQTRYVTPSGPPTLSSAVFWSSEQACVDYGFGPGTSAYGNCVARERAARTGGRVSADYAEVNLTRDAHDACYSYGLQPRTASYDRCVGREIDARRYRSEASERAYPSAATYAYVEPRPATIGQVAFRDEFGFRYDSQGNRLDRNGNIISPLTTTPLGDDIYSLYLAVVTPL